MQRIQSKENPTIHCTETRNPSTCSPVFPPGSCTTRTVFPRQSGSCMNDVILSITQAFISKSSYKCINMKVDQCGWVEALQRKQKSRELKHLKYFWIVAVMLSVYGFVTGKETFKKRDFLWSGRNDRQ